MDSIRYDVIVIVHPWIDLHVLLVRLRRSDLFLLFPLLLEIVHVVPLDETLLFLEAVTSLGTGTRHAALDARILLVRLGMRAAALLIWRIHVEPGFLLNVAVVETLLLNFVVIIYVMTISFDVFSQGRRIGVPLRTSRYLAAVRLVHGMGPGVLEPVRGIRIGFVATLDGTDVGTLAGMRTRVDLQVLGSAEALIALEAMVRLLVRMRAYVD